MAANPVLIDSSYYIGLARQGRQPLRALSVIAAQRDVAVCGVVRCEVARGIKREADLRNFRRAWDVMLHVPTDNRVWEGVERTLWELDREGVRLPLPDVVIAECARRIHAVVLTFDRHFEQIPGIRAVAEIV